MSTRTKLIALLAISLSLLQWVYDFEISQSTKTKSCALRKRRRSPRELWWAVCRTKACWLGTSSTTLRCDTSGVRQAELVQRTGPRQDQRRVRLTAGECA